MTTNKTLLRHHERWTETIRKIAARDPYWSDLDVRMLGVAIGTRQAIAETLAERGVEIPKPTERC